MAKQYLVSNPSSAPICIVGRRRLEIPAQCVNAPCVFSGDEEAKATIAKLKRRYPLLKFEPVGEEGTPAVGANPASPASPASPDKQDKESKPTQEVPQTAPTTPAETSLSDIKVAAKRGGKE